MRKNTISAAIALTVIVASSGQTLRANNIYDLTFSGTYGISGPVFGESGDAVPFEYTLRYDPSLDTNTEFFDTGDSIGSSTTTHQWYGYSASGIVSSDITFGTKTWPSSTIQPITPGSGPATADIWFDTDISTGATPTLSAMLFQDSDGDVVIGGIGGSPPTIFLLAGSNIFDSNTGGLANGPQTITMTKVPEPATITMLLIVVGAIVGAVRRR